MRTIIWTAVALLFVAQSAAATIYKVDPAHTQIHFKVDHMMISSVRGEFNDYTATVEADPGTKTVKAVNAVIKTASIDTRNQKRDDHLRSADFFDAANHPEMTFESARIVGSGDDIVVFGNLTIRGVTKMIELRGRYTGEIKDPWGNIRSGFQATGTINRKDFGLTWNKVLEAGGVTVGDTVEIGLEVEAVRQ